jgi:hypothetical protein
MGYKNPHTRSGAPTNNPITSTTLLEELNVMLRMSTVAAYAATIFTNFISYLSSRLRRD